MIDWRPPPEGLAASPARVDLWRVALEQPAATVETLAGFLDADERRRAARFSFEGDRRRFVVGRGALRIILARYLGTTPAEPRFRYGPHGKPALRQTESPLARRASRPSLSFNVSHAGGLALIAVADGRAVGVDVEQIRPNVATLAIASRFFSPAEVAALRSLSPEARQLGFFTCWTRKEAYVKARGEGLAARLESFVVSLAPDEPAALLHVDGDRAEAARWSLRSLDLGPGYAGALVVEGFDWCLAGWETPLGG